MSSWAHIPSKGEGEEKPSGSHFKEGLPKILTILILLLLTYGHHLQSDSIRQLN